MSDFEKDFREWFDLVQTHTNDEACIRRCKEIEKKLTLPEHIDDLLLYQPYPRHIPNPVIVERQHAYLALLKNAYNTFADADWWEQEKAKRYLAAILSKNRPFPSSYEALQADFEVWARNELKKNLTIWPDNGSVETLIDLALKLLEPEDATLLTLLCGFSEPALKRTDIAKRLAQPIHEISHRIHRGLHTLRRPEICKHLRFLLAFNVDDASISEAQEALRKLATFSDPSWDFLKNLTMPVGDIHFSVRAGNVLQNFDIFFVWELARYPPGELLKRKSCGEKTLEEFRAALRRLNLDLGISFTDEQVATFRQIIAERSKK
jgi:hypothetical protein